jgi:restriction endonuclease
METGTGKTYVYLRTVFELNQRYGFTKFVVVVPSVAIKEGVNKTCRSPASTSSVPRCKGLRVLPVRL